MDAERLNLQVARGIGGNSTMEMMKDMELLRVQVERDTWGNGCRVADTGME
jgi:hypothetical protein